MSMLKIFDIASSGMNAQTARLTATASNVANAGIAASSPDAVYKARYPVFSTVQEEVNSAFIQGKVGVAVKDVIESNLEANKQYEPGNPQADENGFVYYPNVNRAEEMANLISASRSHQLNSQVLNSAKQLMMKTLQIGQ